MDEITCSSCARPIKGYPIYIDGPCVYTGPYTQLVNHAMFMGWHVSCGDCTKGWPYRVDAPIPGADHQEIISSPEELALWVMSNAR